MNTEKICCSWYNQNFNFQILPKTNQLIGIKLYIHAEFRNEMYLKCNTGRERGRMQET